MFLWSSKFKRFLISEHSKDNVGDFVHYSAHSNFSWLCFAFFVIVSGKNGIARRAFFLNGHRVHSSHMECCTDLRGASFGHFVFGASEFTGLSLTRVEAKVSSQLLGFMEQREVSNLRENDERRVESDSRNGLQQDKILLNIRFLLNQSFYILLYLSDILEQNLQDI